MPDLNTCLGVPLDEVVGAAAQVKHRLALGAIQHCLGGHEAGHHNEVAAVG